MTDEVDPFEELFSEQPEEAKEYVKPKKATIAKSKKAKKKAKVDDVVADEIGAPLGHKAPTPEGSINQEEVNAKSAEQSHKYIGSPAVQRSYVEDMVRREEIEAELIRTEGRFIEGSDDARPGTPFNSNSSNNALDAPKSFTQPLAYQYRSDGVDFTGDILDTGEGAQQPVPHTIDPETGEKYDTADPRSSEFITCGNGNCPYREHCLRYRMKDMRDNMFVFFPEECRTDGVYVNIDDHPDYRGYGKFEATAISGTPNLGTPRN